MSGGLSAGTLALIAAGTAAAGAGVSAYSSNQQMRKQDSIAAQGIRDQQANQSQAQAGVAKTIQKVGANNAATEAANKAATQSQYLDALRRAAPVQDASQTATPGASSRYAKQVVDAQAANRQFGATQAGLLARTDAPQLTQLQDQQTLGDEATKLGLLNDTSNNQNNLTKLRVGAVQQSPWLTAAGALLNGASAGASTAAGAKKPAGAASSGAGIYADNGLGGSLGANA
jgi:hypothetical protein